MRFYGERELGRRKRWGRRRHGMKQARSRATEAAQCGGRGRCLTTTIALLLPNADPAVQIPCNLIRQWHLYCESNPRTRPKIGKVCATIATVMIARSPAVRWMEVCEGAFDCHHCHTLAGQLRSHSTHILWSLNSARVGIDDWGFWQAFPSFHRGAIVGEGCATRTGSRLGGRGQTSPRCSSMISTWKKINERCPRHALGSGNCVLLDAGAPLSSRAGGVAAMSRGVTKWTRICIIVSGSAEPMQVRSLTRHSISFTKPPKPNTLWIASGSGGWCHALGRCKTQKRELGDNLEIAY